MESKVQAVADLELEEKDAMAMAAAASPAPAAIFAFLASALSLLRHVACLCAGYLGLDGGMKPPAPAPAPALSASSSAAAAACRRDEVAEAAASEDCTEVVPEVRSRAAPKPSVKPPPQTRSVPRQSRKAERGGDHN